MQLSQLVLQTILLRDQPHPAGAAQSADETEPSPSATSQPTLTPSPVPSLTPTSTPANWLERLPAERLTGAVVLAVIGLIIGAMAITGAANLLGAPLTLTWRRLRTVPAPALVLEAVEILTAKEIDRAAHGEDAVGAGFRDDLEMDRAIGYRPPRCEHGLVLQN